MASERSDFVDWQPMQSMILVRMSCLVPDCARRIGVLAHGVYHSIQCPRKLIIEFVALHNQTFFFAQMIERSAHSGISSVSAADTSGYRFTTPAPSGRGGGLWTAGGGLEHHDDSAHLLTLHQNRCQCDQIRDTRAIPVILQAWKLQIGVATAKSPPLNVNSSHPSERKGIR